MYNKETVGVYGAHQTDKNQTAFLELNHLEMRRRMQLKRRRRDDGQFFDDKISYFRIERNVIRENTRFIYFRIMRGTRYGVLGGANLPRLQP